jgi:hypothetical protein
MQYYTYAYLREDRTPYYVGKGSKDRATNKNRKNIKAPKDKSRIIFLKKNLTEEEAFKHEIYMIAVFGRKDLGTGILHNRTNGGEGTSGFKQTDETIRKRKEACKLISKQTAEKISKANKGKTHSKETKRKISEANKGKIISEETRKKISEANLGEKNYFYGKSEYGGWNKGIPTTEEVKKKLKKAHSSWFIFKYKDDSELKLFTTLKSFCEEYKLDMATMRRVMNNKQYYNQHKGWTVKKLVQDS